MPERVIPDFAEFAAFGTWQGPCFKKGFSGLRGSWEASWDAACIDGPLESV